MRLWLLVQTTAIFLLLWGPIVAPLVYAENLCKDIEYKDAGSGDLLKSTDCVDKVESSGTRMHLFSCTNPRKPGIGEINGLHLTKLDNFSLAKDESLTFKKGLHLVANFGNAQSEWLFEISDVRSSGNEKVKTIVISVQDKAQVQAAGSSQDLKKESSGIQSLSISLARNKEDWVPKEIMVSNGLRFKCGGGAVGDALLSL